MKKYILILFLIIFLAGCNTSNIKTSDVTKDNNVSNKVDSNNYENSDVNDAINEEEVGNNTENTFEDYSNITSNEEDESLEEVSYSSKDIEVINKVLEMNKKVDTLLLDDKNEDSRNKAKGVFITLVDFVFYDGKINNITFAELTEKGKEKVLKLINNIDNKIEKHFPNYKESIADSTKDAFNKASELIKKGGENIKNFSKDMLGEKYYQDIINAQDEFVKYTKDAWSLLKDVGSSLFEGVKDKLGNWYNDFKNNN